MKSVVKNIELSTSESMGIIDITEKVREILAASEIKNGLANIITQHTTSAININENEKNLRHDMIKFLKDFVPREKDYAHNRVSADGRDNAHAHILSLFTNASESIPVSNGRLVLGSWQSVFFIELDGPRPKRVVTVQVFGE